MLERVGRYSHVYGALRERVDDQWAILEVDIPQDYNQTFHNYPIVLDKVFEASKGIRTIDGKDKLANEESLTRARQLIAKAEVIYILGFGFDASNVERLALKKLAPPQPASGPPSRSVYFTNFRGLDSVSMAAGRTLLGYPNVLLSGSAQTHQTSQMCEGVEINYRYQMSFKNAYDAIAEDFEFMGASTA